MRDESEINGKIDEFAIAMLQGRKFEDGDGYIYFADLEKYGPRCFRVDIGDGKSVELSKLPNLSYLTEIIEPSPWYENIPEGGVLCWVWDDICSGKDMTIIKAYCHDCRSKFKGCDGSEWIDAVPVKPEEAMNLVYQAEEETPKLEDKWIKFDENDKSTWPVLGRRVLAHDMAQGVGGFGTVSARYTESGWYLENELDKNCSITHWMDLPAAPIEAHKTLED